MNSNFRAQQNFIKTLPGAKLDPNKEFRRRAGRPANGRDAAITYIVSHYQHRHTDVGKSATFTILDVVAGMRATGQNISRVPVIAAITTLLDRQVLSVVQPGGVGKGNARRFICVSTHRAC